MLIRKEKLENAFPGKTWRFAKLVNKCLVFLLIGAGQVSVSASQLTDLAVYPETGASKPMPQFKVDASWPSLPDTWLIGQVPGLAVDKSDDVWVLHRPNSLSQLDLALEQSPPTGVCCRAAPHVLRFNSKGELKDSWGGEEISPEINGVNQWPANVHGLFVDNKNTVWIGGNGEGDHVVLNFSADGKFIRQFGERKQTQGNLSESTLGNPADIHHDSNSGEVIIADGYINKRIIGFDAKSNAFKRFWGAYANAPGGGTREGSFDVSQATASSSGVNTNGQHFGDIVHCIEKSKDGRIYVCDRRNNRLQVFKEDSSGDIQFVQDVVIAGGTAGLGSASDVTFSPDNQYLYVADMMNGRIWVLWHDTYEVLGSFGRVGRYAGEFTWLHSIVADSKGNLYTSEVSTGRRVQKFVLSR